MIVFANTELRWLTKTNRVTSEDVRRFRGGIEGEGHSMMEAKRILENRIGPILQHRVDGEWVDVPFLTEYRE